VHETIQQAFGFGARTNDILDIVAHLEPGHKRSSKAQQVQSHRLLVEVTSTSFVPYL
jgi:hypothetical protein